MTVSLYTRHETFVILRSSCFYTPSWGIKKNEENYSFPLHNCLWLDRLVVGSSHGYDDRILGQFHRQFDRGLCGSPNKPGLYVNSRRWTVSDLSSRFFSRKGGKSSDKLV